MAMKISTNFTLEEMYSSATAKAHGVNNTPTAEIQRHIVELVTTLLQPLRDAWGSGIKVTSGYRCKRLNQLVGGSSTSSHMSGYAADMKPANGDMKKFQKFVKEWLEKNKKNFDQMIIEYPKNGIATWIHLSVRKGNGQQRKQFLTLG